MDFCDQMTADPKSCIALFYSANQTKQLLQFPINNTDIKEIYIDTISHHFAASIIISKTKNKIK